MCRNAEYYLFQEAETPFLNSRKKPDRIKVEFNYDLFTESKYSSMVIEYLSAVMKESSAFERQTEATYSCKDVGLSELIESLEAFLKDKFLSIEAFNLKGYEIPKEELNQEMIDRISDLLKHLKDESSWYYGDGFPDSDDTVTYSITMY
ncbi:hypothetical protein [Guggenheimella bovis]